MVDQKWVDTASNINSLVAGFPALSVKQILKKWADMKSQAKKAVTKWNFECRRTGGGRNLASKPTEIQFRIASFIGEVQTSGIPGTANCDAAAQAQQQGPTKPTLLNETLSNSDLTTLSLSDMSIEASLPDNKKASSSSSNRSLFTTSKETSGFN